jgi:hypothetical protein
MFRFLKKIPVGIGPHGLYDRPPVALGPPSPRPGSVFGAYPGDFGVVFDTRIGSLPKEPRLLASRTFQRLLVGTLLF